MYGVIILNYRHTYIKWGQKKKKENQCLRKRTQFKYKLAFIIWLLNKLELWKKYLNAAFAWHDEWFCLWDMDYREKKTTLWHVTCWGTCSLKEILVSPCVKLYTRKIVSISNRLIEYLWKVNSIEFFQYYWKVPIFIVSDFLSIAITFF